MSLGYTKNAIDLANHYKTNKIKKITELKIEPTIECKTTRNNNYRNNIIIITVISIIVVILVSGILILGFLKVQT